MSYLTKKHLLDQLQIIGKSLREAQQLIEAAGLKHEVISIDGRGLMISGGSRPEIVRLSIYQSITRPTGKFTFEILDGIVSKAT